MIKNVVSSFIFQIITCIIGFFIPRLILQAYGSEVNGLVNSIVQFVALITILDFGLNRIVKALLYKPISNKNKQEIENILEAADRFYKRVSIVFLLYVVLLILFIPSKVDFDNKWYVISLIIIISIKGFIEYFVGIVYEIYLKCEQKSYVIKYIQSSVSIISSIALIVLIKSGASIHVVQLVAMFIFIVKPVLQKIYAQKTYQIDLKNADKTYELPNKWDATVQHISSAIHDKIDIIVLLIFSNIKEISVYAIYMLVINEIRHFSETLSYGLDDFFGKVIAKNDRELDERFDLFEFIYSNVVTIIFMATFILIVPFITVYTKGIIDANYIRPIFAIIMTLAEFVYAIRLPYYALICALGLFKETEKGAVVEAVLNLFLSVILVQIWGIIGVAIGTLIAMLIRTIDVIYYCFKNIFSKRENSRIKGFIMIILESAIIIFVFYFLKWNNINSYVDWIKYATEVTAISFCVVAIVNWLFRRKELKESIKYIKNLRKG